MAVHTLCESFVWLPFTTVIFAFVELTTALSAVVCASLPFSTALFTAVTFAFLLLINVSFVFPAEGVVFLTRTCVAVDVVTDVGWVPFSNKPVLIVVGEL